MFLLLLFSALWAMCCGLPHQYHFRNETKTWSEAQTYCRNTYTDLATVDNMEDMNKLLESANGSYSGSAWIGLSDDPQKGWRWSLDDPQFYKEGERDFRRWLSTMSYPAQRDSCVYSSQGVWQTSSCNSKVNPFLCFDGRENATQSFVLNNYPKTWFDAQQYCRKKYTDLASIRNPTESYMLNHKFPSFWTGLYRMRKWSDQSNTTFRNWETEDLMSMANPTLICTNVLFGNLGKWTESDCYITLPFICYTVSNGSVRQYHFVNESKSWFDAQSFCRTNYTDLATVDNMEDMNRLLESANGSYSGSAWIGLYDEPENDWRWSLDDPKYYKDGERDFRHWRQHPYSSFQYDRCGAFSYPGWTDQPCSYGYRFVCYDGQNANQTHVLVSSPKNWTDAQAYCREHYTDLASVRNLQEQIKIYNMVQKTGYVWIGLRRVITWSDQSNSTFSNWRSGEPDNGFNTGDYYDQHCAAASFSDGKWSDENCFSTRPFICYSLNSTVQPSTTPTLPPQTKVNSTVQPSTTPTLPPQTKGHVIGLRSAVIEHGVPESDLENLVLMKVKEELGRLGVPSNFTMRVRHMHKVSP